MILNTLQQNGIRKHPQPQQHDEELRQHTHQEIGLPSVYVFNDSAFKPEDFDNICKLGVGGKHGLSKIGQFRVGFGQT